MRDAAAALTAAEAGLALSGNYAESIKWEEKAKADANWLEDEGLDGGARAPDL